MDDDLKQYLDQSFQQFGQQIQQLRVETTQQFLEMRDETAQQFQEMREDVRGAYILIEDLQGRFVSSPRASAISPSRWDGWTRGCLGRSRT